ncbi:MAG: hypothetical protein V3T22_13495, partial [Planctomycetota bacterium]
TVVEAAGEGAALGEWPRSTVDDVRDAVDALRRGSADWASRAPLERCAILSSALQILGTDPDPGNCIARTLGLPPAELARRAARLPRRVGLPQVGRAGGDVAGSAPPAPSDPGGGLALVHRHWSELHEGAAGALCSELAAGRVVLLLGDPRVPALADRLAVALVAAGVPAGALAVLHDDADDTLRAALISGAFERVVASGHGSDESVLARSIETLSGQSAFGRGVLDTSLPELVFTRLECGRARVRRGDDPAQRAREVARAAFGSSQTMSGQLPGQVGVVTVDPRRLSVFTAELLVALEVEQLAEPCLPFVDRGLGALLEGQRDLGLDEGATLIHEGLRSGSRPSGEGAKLARLIFTNVEPRMRLLAGGRPAPLLLLVREEDSTST